MKKTQQITGSKPVRPAERRRPAIRRAAASTRSSISSYRVILASLSIPRLPPLRLMTRAALQPADHAGPRRFSSGTDQNIERKMLSTIQAARE